MTTAIDSILEMYSKEKLKDIATHGCVSGSASYHIYHSDCIDFYKKHSDEIDSYICDELGHKTPMELCVECSSIDDSMSHLCWVFIELVALAEAFADED